MNFKRTFKFTLCAFLLGTGVSAFAQDGKVVQLSNSAGTKTWEEFANVINGKTAPAVPDGLQTAYETAVSEQKTAKDNVDAQQLVVDGWARRYKAANDSLSRMRTNATTYEPKTETVTLKYSDETWFKTQKYAYETVLDYVVNATGTQPNVTYYISSGLSKVLYISFDGTTPTKPADTEKAQWATVSISKFYTDVVESTTVKPSSLRVFLGYANEAKTAFNYTEGTDGYMLVSGYSSSNKEGMFDAIETAFVALGRETTGTKTQQTAGYAGVLKDINDKQAWVDKLQSEQEAAEGVLAPLQTALETANGNVEKAQKDIDDAKTTALSAYQDVTLMGNVTANTAITVDYKGRIRGAGYVITIPTGTTLFDTFGGTVGNIAINGDFAHDIEGAKFNKVAVNSSTGYRYYNDAGVVNDSYTSLAQLGFAVRASFGVDLANANNGLTNLSDATKVFDITIYDNPNAASPAQRYANVSKSGFVNMVNKSTGALDNKSIGANTFVYSATTDFGDLANVFVGEAGSYTCANVNITDGKDVSFYCPVELEAANMTYSRELSNEYNSVCLPFDLQTSYFPTGALVSRYDKETPSQFWFTSVSTYVPANIPALIKLPAGAKVKLENLKDVTLKQTDRTQIVVDEGAKDEPSKIYGTFKRVNVGEFAGESNTNKIYGLTGGKFQPAVVNDLTNFPAFRMVIWTALSTSGSYNGAAVDTREIVIADEDGNILSGGGSSLVESVMSDDSSLNVVGGQGEIVITTDADYGKVQVYNLNGGVAAVADVMAGTTSVNVEKGVYIVMGKKVMVK